MTNVSHEIHHLSFGDPSMSRIIERGRAYVPDDLNGKLSPMDGFVYVTSVSSTTNINDKFLSPPFSKRSHIFNKHYHYSKTYHI